MCGADDRTILAKALVEVERTVALAPDWGPAHAIFGNALAFSWDCAQAGKEQNLAMERAPGDAWINTRSGFYNSMTGNIDAAVAAATCATELNPLSVEAFYNLAQAYACVGRYDETVRALQKATSLGLGAP